MAASKKNLTPVNIVFYKASFSVIALLILNCLLFFMIFMSAFGYLSGGEPPWYDKAYKASLLFLMYGAPCLIFLGAGAFIGMRLRTKGMMYGARFGLMWGTIICLSLQIMYAVLLLTNVYQLNEKFLIMWSKSSVAVLFAGSGVVVLSAIGGALGQRYRSKK